MTPIDVLFFDDHNVLLNGQPYPLNSVRPRFPVVAGDNVAALYFPYWSNLAIWSGDVTQLQNGLTSLPFLGIADFKTFCNDHFYTDTSMVPILNYLGAWDASTNTPTLTNGDPDPAGDFYITSVAGTTDFGAGPITFAVGDLVVYNGSIWQNVPSASVIDLQAVTSLGNTTDQGIVFNDGTNTLATITTPGGGSPSVIGLDSVDHSTGLALVTMPDNSLNEIAFINAGGEMLLHADVLTGIRTQQFQDADGTIALEETMTLQKTTDAGNTTTDGLAYVDGSGNILAGIGPYGVAGLSSIGTQSTDASTGVGFATKPDTTVNEIAFYNIGGAMRIKADVLTGIHDQQLQDRTGTIALTTIHVNAQTGTSYTPALSDVGGMVTCSNTAHFTITIPANATVAFPVGTQIQFARLNTGAVSFSAASGVTVNSIGGAMTILGRYDQVVITKLTTNGWLLTGSLI